MTENTQITQDTSLSGQPKELPKYERPELRVMDESEVLSAFQVTAAGTTTWWAM